MKTNNLELNIDKFEIAYRLNLHTKELFDNIDEALDMYNFEIIRTNKEKEYENTFDIIIPEYDEKIGIFKKKYATIYYGSNNIFRQHLYLKIENEELYKENFGILDYLEDCLDLEFLLNSEIELAVDTDFNIISRFYRLLKNKKYTPKILKKYYYDMNKEISNVLNFSKGTRNNPFKFKSFYIKNKEGGLELKCYDKLKEITDNGNEKQYIKDKLGFNNIFRLEVNVKHKLLKDTLNKMKITDMDIRYNLFNKDFISNLYIELLNRLIMIRYKENNYNFLSILLN